MGILDQLGVNKAEYKTILGDEKSSVDGEESDPLRGLRPARSTHRTNWTILLLYATIAFLCISLFTITGLYVRLASQDLPRKELRCGNSLQEAYDAGCTFDMLSKAWLPAECPRYGEQEYLDASQDYDIPHWKYFTNNDGTTELEYEDLALRVDNYPGEKWSWSGTDREHMVHCAWILIRLAHAHKMGDRVDGLTADYPHTKHCTLALLKRAMFAPDLDLPVTRGDIIFGSC